MIKKKKIPLRKCTGCQEMKGKKELVRIVKSNEGEFSLDTTGKKPGRGAYICKDVTCIDKAKKAKGLERSFKSPVPVAVYEKLREELVNVEDDE